MHVAQGGSLSRHVSSVTRIKLVTTKRCKQRQNVGENVICLAKETDWETASFTLKHMNFIFSLSFILSSYLFAVRHVRTILLNNGADMN